MPNFTTNLNLEKPLVNENYNIEVFNTNADKLDIAIKEVSSKVDNFQAPVKSVNGKTGAVTLAAVDIKTTDGKTLEQFKADASSQLDTKANLVDGKVSVEELPSLDFIPISEKGVANGVATLGSDGKLSSEQSLGGIDTLFMGNLVANSSKTLTGIDMTKYKYLEFSPIYTSSSGHKSYEITINGVVLTTNFYTVSLKIFPTFTLRKALSSSSADTQTVFETKTEITTSSNTTIQFKNIHSSNGSDSILLGIR